MEGRLTKAGIKALLAPVIWIATAGLVFFIGSGEIRNLRVWIYIGIYIIGGLVAGILLGKNSPGLLNDRGKIQEGTMQLDKYFLLAYLLFAIIIIPLTAGIDRRIRHYDTIPFGYLYAAIILYGVSALLSVWAMLHNPFFEGTVRIQEEKNHYVVKAGPYKYVRHPGYLGIILGTMALTLALGSILAHIPLLLMVILMIVRTHYEDTLLRKELPGYSEYCREVRYRLIPYIW